MENPKHIQHLYWRAGFGLSPQEWQERKNWPQEKAMEELFGNIKNNMSLPVPALLPRQKNMEQAARSEIRKKEKQLVSQINAAWLARMAGRPENNLLEKMTLFWHGHFACEIKQGKLAAQYLNNIRKYALGNFRELALAIARDPAMIRYLNNQQNKKRKPNENFARELMELFTIGRGNYSEQDIKESARAFTGWSSGKNGEYVFQEKQHDFGQKTFMEKRENFNGEDIIDIILEKRETAVFICRKIYRYFVNEKVDEKRVETMADIFFENYDIGKLMRRIFESDWFYSPENIGTKIKSPIELLAGMMRQFNLSDANQKAVIGLQKALGQVLFKPPNVAGWPGGKTWIDNSTLMMRLNLAAGIFHASDMDFNLKTELKETGNKRLKKLDAKIDFEPILNMSDGADELGVFELYVDYFIQAKNDLDKNLIEKYVRENGREEYMKTLCIRLMTLPEYQMC